MWYHVFMKKKKYSLEFIAFFQALGLVAYCGLIAFFLFNANSWFGKTDSYFAPLLGITLFSTSALICALIVGTHPFLLWQKKKTKEALQLVLYTAAWLIVFVLTIIFFIANIG